MSAHGNYATGLHAMPGVETHRPQLAVEMNKLSAELTQWFAAEFVVLDGQTGELVDADGPHLAALPPAWDWWCELARVVAGRGRPELIEEEGPLAVVAIPLSPEPHVTWVALGIVVTRSPIAGERLTRAAELLGQPAAAADVWIRQQHSTPPDAILRLAELFAAKYKSDRRREHLEQEVDSLALHLSTTYEEISLLYRLTQNLKITRRDEDLGRLALDWLAEVAPAESLAIHMLPLAEPGPMNRACAHGTGMADDRTLPGRLC